MQLLSMVCPVDDLEFIIPWLDEWGDHMATWQVGDNNTYHNDATVQCANGHKWALNFNMAFVREA